MQDILVMGADAAEYAKHALHEERRLDEAAIREMGERVEMADVVALAFEARAVIGACCQDLLDIGEGVLGEAGARSFEIRALPIVLELLEPREHRIKREIHRPHIEGGDL